MKKKLIIITTCLILAIGIFGFVFFTNKAISIITLDINPSIEINLDKDEKVINIKGLNDDAKDIITNDYNNKTLDEVFELLITNLIDKGYVNNSNLDVILYTSGKVKNEEITRKIEFVFGKKDVHTEIIVVKEITKEDEEIAKKYNISPAKASYIKSITEDNKNIKVEDLKDKAVSELKETKMSGNYCSQGYTLEGDWCLKEIDRVSAVTGSICPVGYLEYEGKCYEEVRSEETGKLICRDGFKLENGECVRKTSVEAIVTEYTCSKGEVRTKAEVGQAPNGSGDANDPVCVDASSITHPVSPCELPASDPTERMSYGGKCYWHRASVIEAGCPGKKQVNGFCWDEATNVYLCPNGNNSNLRNKDDYCYTILKNVKPTPSNFKCEGAMILDGNKCISEEKEEVMRERTCPSGYTLVNNDRCINYAKVAKKENGLVCNMENAKLEGNTCIIYEILEANHN